MCNLEEKDRPQRPEMKEKDIDVDHARHFLLFLSAEERRTRARFSSAFWVGFHAPIIVFIKNLGKNNIY